MKAFIAFFILASSLAHASECTVKLNSDYLAEDSIESIARGLEEKGYVLSPEGSLSLRFRERIDHVGNQYVLAGMNTIMTDANHNRIAEGYSKRRIFRSHTTLIMKSFRDLLAKLKDCQ